MGVPSRSEPGQAIAAAEAATSRPLLFCGDLDIRIASDGTWFHEGTPIGRLALVRLFAGLLRREAEGDFWLVTPVERARIRVDDAPFLAVELKAEGEGRAQRLSFRTNLDDWVTADRAHPLWVRQRPGRADRAPYLMVRDGLEARLTQAVFYELIEHAREETQGGEAVLGVDSAGTFFPLGPSPRS